MRARKIKLDGRAFADLAIDLHMAARLLDEAIDLRKAQPGAVTDVLGCKKWIECLIPHLRRHPAAVSVTASITY